ncbi:MAG: hypothetical protein H6841_07180 [Planctomycetes bacterium]|nr:hypothetical protein [Planctomycetota bacterium]MCB9935748.1 hypothetical protein [Planctomycetota bacterium]
MQELKTRFWTRLSFAALALALLAGAFTGGVLVNANADAQPAAPPEPRRTAYIDFLSLLKKDKPLAIKQVEIAQDVERNMADIEKRWGEEIKAQEEIKRSRLPDTRDYRKAMEKQLDAARSMYEEKLRFEQLAQEDLRSFGIERFQALQNLARDEAKQRGYNEVLNIVRKIEEVSAQEDSFQALQQQLLISPVLYFEETHDITDAVQAAADKLWGSTITMKPYNAETGVGGISFVVQGGAEALKRNAEGEIEIRLGQSGEFKVQVLDKDAPAEGAAAEVDWIKRGLDTGELGKKGEYKAPDAFPVAAGDTFTVTVRSKKDPTISEEVTIRLLDKDGKPMPPKDN